METKPGLTKNDALIHQTLSKKTGVRGRLYHLTTGGLIGVGRRAHGTTKPGGAKRPKAPAASARSAAIAIPA